MLQLMREDAFASETGKFRKYFGHLCVRGGERGLFGVLQIYRLTRGARSRVDRVQRSSFIWRVLMLLGSAFFYKV